MNVKSWNPYDKIKPEVSEEVICFNPAWINEDFNPKGIRTGRLELEDEFSCVCSF